MTITYQQDKSGDGYWQAVGTIAGGRRLIVEGKDFIEAFLGFCAAAWEAAK